MIKNWASDDVIQVSAPADVSRRQVLSYDHGHPQSGDLGHSVAHGTKLDEESLGMTKRKRYKRFVALHTSSRRRRLEGVKRKLSALSAEQGKRCPTTPTTVKAMHSPKCLETLIPI
jgi:hypothetical protein